MQQNDCVEYVILQTDGQSQSIKIHKQQLAQVSTYDWSQINTTKIDLKRCQGYTPENMQEFINQIYKPQGTWFMVTAAYLFKLDITIQACTDKLLGSLLQSYQNQLQYVSDDDSTLSFQVFSRLIKSRVAADACKNLAQIIFSKFGARLFFCNTSINPYVKDFNQDQFEYIVNLMTQMTDAQKQRVELILMFLQQKANQFQEENKDYRDQSNSHIKRIFFSDYSQAQLTTVTKIQLYADKALIFEVLSGFKQHYQNTLKQKEKELIMKELRRSSDSQDLYIYHDLETCKQKNSFAILACGHRQCLNCAKSVTIREDCENIKCFKSIKHPSSCQVYFSESDRAKIPFN